jgi:hypothetical protein
MTQDRRRKTRIRERMRETGEPYMVAMRAIDALHAEEQQQTSEQDPQQSTE